MLGMAMGQLVLAKLDVTNIPKYFFLAELTALAEKLNRVINSFGTINI